MTLFWIIFTVWCIVGFFMLRFEGGWLIMITDRLNTHRTWMTWPALVSCIILWPVNKWVARTFFLLSIAKSKLPFDEPKSKKVKLDTPPETTHKGKQIIIDYDVNSMYWQIIEPLTVPDKDQEK